MQGVCGFLKGIVLRDFQPLLFVQSALPVSFNEQVKQFSNIFRYHVYIQLESSKFANLRK